MMGEPKKPYKGNFKMFSEKSKKPRKARPITGVARDIEINQAFFKYASEMRQVA
jgi:hypothetical protein